jgi:segregation and condensation protein B
MPLVDTPEDTPPNQQAPDHSVDQALDHPAERTPDQLKSALESLLFVAGRPLERAELRRLLSASPAQLEAALNALAAECEGRGVRVQRLGEQVQLVSAPENAPYVAALLGLPSHARLTTAALETLAVVAYRQPITRSQIEIIRGVNSDHALASLVAHSLVSEVGRAATVGRPTLFATTPEFLQQFGLETLETLPPLGDATEALARLEAAPTAPAASTQAEQTPAQLTLLQEVPGNTANGRAPNGRAANNGRATKGGPP